MKEHFGCCGCNYEILSSKDFPCSDCTENYGSRDKENRKDYWTANTVSVDNVDHPNHYTRGGIECIKAIEIITEGLTAFEAYCTGTILKYIWRWKWKNGIEDLKKAKKYIDFLIEFLEKNNAAQNH